MQFLNSLSGRFLILTAVFVMLAEVLIFVPSIARFREEFLSQRLERAQLASLALLAEARIDAALEEELLQNAGVFNVVMRRDEARQLILAAPLPLPVSTTFDLRDASAFILIRDAMARLLDSEDRVVRVIGEPAQMGGLLIEVTMATRELRNAMIDYGLRILWLSAVISVVTAGLLFFVVRYILVKPIERVVGHMDAYAQSPEDARLRIVPSAGVIEVRKAEEALQALQDELTAALRQRERLAQLGGAVAKISHDLRNILSSAQLFTDRIEMSEDPTVRRLAPKLVNSITRAVHLCESSLTYGKADEPAPMLVEIMLSELVNDVFDGERLTVEDQSIQFEMDIPPTPNLRADNEQLYRVISNLVRNARQAMLTAGKTGAIRISAAEAGDHWHIRVSDSGPGLPPKAQEHLFAAFQGSVSKGGTGLGLAISAELVRGHGGTLELESTGPEGTVFLIALPIGAGVNPAGRQ